MLVALAGNPNVGKSTVFNALTGARQHTGNWSGKTVSNAVGTFTYNGIRYELEDVPGTYSLAARSAEEQVARDMICFGGADAVIVVCDATCLRRGIDLVLQILEVTPRVLVCVNLMDEAAKKGITVDTALLARRLGVPVTATAARGGQGLDGLLAALEQLLAAPPEHTARPQYGAALEAAVEQLIPALPQLPGGPDRRWLALRLLENDPNTLSALARHLDFVPPSALADALRPAGLDVSAEISRCTSGTADRLVQDVTSGADSGYSPRDRQVDRVLTGRFTGPLIMVALLALIFWVTIRGANVPSELLSRALFSLEAKLAGWAAALGLPDFVIGLVIHGALRVMFWVVSVMLPPMAIFFPLFTLLEDLGYLPRVAFNLDHCFRRCNACGKQSLTMAMGIGCNAVGVTGCRIIDSPRERLIAILTNSFVPCNGRFPLLIAISGLLMKGGAVLPAAMVLLGIGMTFLASYLLSKTLLRGVSSRFMLELPPFRRPQILRVILRSILDRTLYVLGRAVVVAAPAGAVIWLLANLGVGDGGSLLTVCTRALDPFARLLGLDGVILMAFVLGWPANEIVIPIMMMGYTAAGSLIEPASTAQLRQLLLANGWTWATALCTLLFSLMHWPCSTTCLTIYKETGSLKWTLAAVLLPTACGMVCCALVHFLWLLL